MLRALMWKEWREQRSLVAAGVALSLFLPALLFVVTTTTMPRFSGQRLVDATMMAFIIMLWPMFTAAAAAGTFANEITGRTDGFLLSRPIARSRIWLTKIGLAALAALAVVAVSLLVAWLLQTWVGKVSATDPSLVVLRGDMSDTSYLLLGPPSFYLCFCATAFLSSRVARPMAAALGGLATWAVFVVLIMSLFEWAGLVRAAQFVWVSVEICLAATLMLALSLRRFTRGEALAASGPRRTLATLALVLLLTAAVGFMPAAWATTFTDLDRAITRELAVSPDGTAAVVTAAQWPALFGSLWRLPDQAQPSGGESAAQPVQLTRRLAFAPFFARDGEWVYFFSARAIFGAVRGSADLWKVRIDGSEEQRVGASVAEIVNLRQDWPSSPGTPVVSSDGSRVAFGDGWWGSQAAVIDLESGTFHRVTGLFDGAADSDVSSGWPIAWTETGKLLLRAVQYRSGRAADETEAIVAYDIDASQATTLLSWQADRTDWYFNRFYPVRYTLNAYAPGERLPVQIYDRERSDNDSFSYGYWELALVDLGNNQVETVESFPCGNPAAAVSADGTVVSYRRHTRCVRQVDGELVGADPVVVVLDLESGNTRELYEPVDPSDERATYDINYFRLSPGGTRASFWFDGGLGVGGSYQILEADGSTRLLDVRRYVRGVLRGPQSTPGWIDDDHVLLRYVSSYRIDRLRVGAVVIMNVNDGSVAHEFVIPPSDRNIHY